jgi:hypothetical protein
MNNPQTHKRTPHWRQGTGTRVVTDNQNPTLFRPFCKACGWRKGGVDSWNGSACKCGHSEPPIKPVEPK